MSFEQAYNVAYSKKALGGDLLTDSNVKVKAYLFSLPPIKSCLNCASCKNDCYATKAYNQYPSAKALWDYNFYLVQNDLQELERRLVLQLDRIAKGKNTKKVVRIHQSGDFYTQEYLDMWTSIAMRYPSIRFYGYTKVEKILDFTRFEALPNVAVVKSLIDGKYRNYGTVDYVERMSKKVFAIVCPATHGENKAEIKCGVQCSACISKGCKVLFVQH